jgi:hypothetical protein
MKNSIIEEQCLENPDVKKALEAFEEMRRKIKKPLTEYARELLKRRLLILCKGDAQKAVEILDKSIFNCYQGIFPV